MRCNVQDFYAHSVRDRPKSEWQELRVHLLAVAERCFALAEKFGAGGWGYLAGLFHDLGKYALRFQQRLSDPSIVVPHAMRGAKCLMDGSSPASHMARLILAHAVAGHHAGLPDSLGTGSLDERLKEALPEVPAGALDWLPADEDLKMPASFRRGSDPAGFQLAMLGRFVFSCLIDADRLDSEAFAAAAEGIEVDRSWPQLQVILASATARLDAIVAARQAQAPLLAPVRTRVFDAARASGAGRPPGIYTMTVPTGGAKTLASLAFAMAHAQRHGLDRIVCVMPFTTIVDQTAEQLRAVFGDDAVLEHHSAIGSGDGSAGDARAATQPHEKLRRAMENWAAPVVATTSVQLLESLFSHRPAQCRKLHNLCRSVIVLDEAQAVPLHVLRPAVAALKELALNYGATVLLCTATQPEVSLQAGFKNGIDFGPDTEIAPDPAGLAEGLRRVTFRLAGAMEDAALLADLAASPQGLVIVNSRAHALSLYEQARAAGIGDVVHLTTRQYPAHRRRILADIRARLKEGRPCRLIATSLVEAGVDLDFPRLWRAEAGLDQVLQAAGRCNREGRMAAQDAIVTVFAPVGWGSPPELLRQAELFKEVATLHGTDLSAPAAIATYFSRLYSLDGPFLDASKGPDGTEVAVMNSFNRTTTGKIDFKYRTVGEAFRLIDSTMRTVIVAADPRAQAAVASLASDAVSTGRIARELQVYTVQVPPHAWARLRANGDVRFAFEERLGDQFPVLVREALYRDDVGLVWEDPGLLRAEECIL